MQGLKFAVIFMGILIVAGFALVIVTLASRFTEDKGTGFGERSLAAPEGCGIASAEAAEDRLIVRLDGLADRGCQQVLVLDLKTGETLGRLSLTATQ